MTADADLSIRPARREDVPAIVGLLADDELGRAREHLTAPLPEPYVRAFDAIAADPGELLVVADDGGRVVGTLQLSIIPGLSRQGALRAQIEAVRVAADRRGGGLGHRLVRWAIDEARARGCVLIQLTSHKRRVGAHRFYAGLGFEATHEGMKLPLAAGPP